MANQVIVPKFQVNVPEWDRAFVKWVAAARVSVREGIGTQARLLFERIVNWRGSAVATPPKSQKEGKLAVKRDIYRAVFPMRAEGFGDPKIRKRVRAAVDGKDYVALQAMLKTGLFGKNLRAANVFKFKPKLHTSQRRSRGRVPRASRYLYATPDNEALDKYVERRQKMVGQGKGGWAASVKRLGGKVAQWIDRHSRAGTFRDNLNDRQPSFTGINNSAWASGGDQDRIIGMAMQGRAMAMVKDIERRMESEWRKHR